VIAMAATMDEQKLERDVQQLGRTLYRKAAQHKPALFESQDLLGKMIDWSLNDESLRVALFRFVDVLPSLESSAEIGRHLEEYFARVDHALGGLVYLAQALHAGRLVAPVVRRNVIKLARRFIAEESGDHLKKVLAELRKEPAAFTLDVVGEATVSDREAAAMQERYLELLRRLTSMTATWPVVPQIDESPSGTIPRVNLSVKLSSLCARFDPLDPFVGDLLLRDDAIEHGQHFLATTLFGDAVRMDLHRGSTLGLRLGIEAKLDRVLLDGDATDPRRRLHERDGLATRR